MPKTPSHTQSRKTAPAASEHARPGKSVAAAVAKVSGPKSSRAPQEGGKIIYCTSASADTLAQALRLRDTLVAVDETIDFRVLLTEHPVVVAQIRAELPKVPMLAPDEVGCRQWLQMAFYLERGEYAAAMKAALMRTLIADGDVIYIDPSCEVFSPLVGFESALRDNDLVLATQPAELPPQAVCAPPPLDILRASGPRLWMVGVARGAAGERFLGWWQDLLADSAPASDAEAPSAAGLWAMAVAAAAPRLKVLASPRYSSAPEAVDLGSWDGVGAPLTPDGPLGVVRYLDAPPADSSAQSLDPAQGGLPVDRLQERYLRTLADSPYQRFAARPYSFGFYLSGAPITSAHRLALWRLPRDRRRLVDNPFTADHGFAKWSFAEPRTTAESASRLYARKFEQRLARLARALIGSAGKTLDSIVPGSRDRVYNALQSLSVRGRAVRGYAGNALDIVMPGSRNRVYNAMKAAVTSDKPGLRCAATVLVGAVGVRF